MKKILAIILVLMLAFSMLLATACNNDSADTGTETSSTPEESSSGRKRGEGVSTTGTLPTTGDTPTSTSGNEPTSSDDGSGGNTSQDPSQLPEYEYNEYDYDYKESFTQPEETISNVGFFDGLICRFAEVHRKPSLNGDYYDVLVQSENEYNKLSAVEKGKVKNYPFLQEARAAYNDMAKKECQLIISTLPDATIDNLTDFAVLTNAVDKLLNRIGDEAKNISNKNIYDQKVAAADSLLTDTFNSKVSALNQSFEYSDAYKAKLDDAGTIYSLMNTSQQAKVATSYSTLTNLRTRYAAATVAYSFVDTVNSLPDVNSLKDTDQAIIKQLKKTYNKMTDAQKAEVPAATKTKYDAYVAKAQVLWPEHVLYTLDNNRHGDDFFKFSEQFSSATGRTEFPTVYEGKKILDGVKFKNEYKITFTTTKAGVLTVYANVKAKDQNPCDIILSLNGTEVSRHAVTNDPTGENTEYTFPCNAVGTYTLSINMTDDKSAALYYLIFS